MNVLTPLFELAAELAMTDLDFVFESGHTHIHWYIGKINDMPEDEDGRVIFEHGSLHDWLMADDLDEDKLCRWVTELQAILDDYNTPLDKDGLPIDDDHHRWQNNEEDSLDEIASRENHLIDSQEETQI